MNISKVAQLARISLTTEEENIYEAQFKSILDYVNQISSIPTEDVEPLINPLEEKLKLRPDECRPWKESGKVLEQAPDVEGHLFKVPPVI